MHAAEIILENCGGPSETLTPEQRLWRAVLATAILDSLGQGPGLDDFAIARGRRWFDPHNPDFTEVCTLAGVDPEFVASRVRSAIGAGRHVPRSGGSWRRAA